MEKKIAQLITIHFLFHFAFFRLDHTLTSAKRMDGNTPTLFTLLWVNPSVEISTRPKNSYIPVSEMNLLLFFQDFFYFGMLSLWLCFSFFPPQIVYYSRWKNFSFNILHAWIFTLFVSLLFSFRLLLCLPINLNSHWKTIHHSEQVLK